MRRDETRLQDFLQAADQIARHITGISRADFIADIKTQDAVIRRIEIMGEAATRISEQFHQAQTREECGREQAKGRTWPASVWAPAKSVQLLLFRKKQR